MADKPQAGVDALLTKRRRGRNVAMLIVLLALCALFYAITIVKLSGEAADSRSRDDDAVRQGR
jgi:hypothetical protein